MKNPEAHNRIVTDAIKQMGLKPPKDSDVERLLREAQQRIKLVRQYAEMIDKEVKVAGKDHNRATLAQEIFNKYLDNFVHYNKDELLLFLARFLSEMTMNEIV